MVTMPDDNTVGIYAPAPVEDLTAEELEALAREYNITNLPPRPWTPRQRHRIETAVLQIQRVDYIYGGAPTRRRATELEAETEMGRYVLQWNIDGPWMDLHSYTTYANAEAARDQVLRQYADSGVGISDLRIVDIERRTMGRG